MYQFSLCTSKQHEPFRHAVVRAIGREAAKSRAHPHLGGNPDHYVVTPLNNPYEEVTLVVYVGERQ